MGHYCYECGEKLVGGVVPTTCECIECYCEKCWTSLFEGEIQIQETVYVKKGDKFEKLNKKLFEKVSVSPKCPNCDIEFKYICVTDY